MIYGLTRMNAGALPGALALYTRALEYTPAYATLEINLGVVNSLLAEQGQPALNAVAEQHFLRAVLLAPGDDTTHAYYGRWLLAQQRGPEAITQLEAAVHLNPQRAMGRDLLLQAYEEAGNISAAKALAESSLVIFPDDTLALSVLNRSYSVRSPSPAAALINASLAAYQAHRFQESIDIARQALQVDPKAAEAWNNVGAGYGALKRWDLGIAAEEQALALNPALAIAGNNLRWFTAQKSAAAAPNGVQRQTVNDYINLSLRLNQAGNYAGSIVAAEHALALDADSAEAWNNIAAANEALHRWDAAIAAAQKAVALRPDFQLAKNNLAWSLQQKAVAAAH